LKEMLVAGFVLSLSTMDSDGGIISRMIFAVYGVQALCTKSQHRKQKIPGRARDCALG